MSTGFAFWAGASAPAPPPAPPNLDAYTTSVFGVWGLIQLLTAYTGNLIQVRRDSDNTTANIGIATGGGLDTAALAAFVGAGSGYVTIWYDQSGGGNNLAQATTGSQPRIVNSGTYDGAVYFDGVDDGMVCVNNHGAPSGSTVYAGGTLRTAGGTRQMIAESDEGLGGTSASLGSIIYDFSTPLSGGMRNILATDGGANLVVGETAPGGVLNGNVNALVCDFSQSTDAARIPFYLNGSLQTLSYADAGTVSTSATLDPAKKWNIGARNGGAALASTVSLIEMVIYEAPHDATTVGNVSTVLQHYL